MKYTFSDYNREGLVNAEKMSHLIIRKYQLYKDKLDDFLGGRIYIPLSPPWILVIYIHAIISNKQKTRQILSFPYLK